MIKSSSIKTRSKYEGVKEIGERRENAMHGLVLFLCAVLLVAISVLSGCWAPIEGDVGSSTMSGGARWRR